MSEESNALNSGSPTSRGSAWTRTGRLRILACAGVIAAFGLWCGVSPGPGPVYKRKPLMEWLQAYSVDESIPVGTWKGRAAETDAVLKEVGTNALPTLIHLLRQRDTKFKLVLFRILERQQAISFYHRDATELNHWALCAFRALGSGAEVAVPDLIETAVGHYSETSRSFAILALGGVGPAAKSSVPALLSLAEDSGPSIRGDAISALGSIHSEPDLVVPVLVRALEDPEAAVRGAALWALQDFGKAASSATPVLTQKLTQGVESNERAIMLNTLAAIGSTNSVLKP